MLATRSSLPVSVCWVRSKGPETPAQLEEFLHAGTTAEIFVGYMTLCDSFLAQPIRTRARFKRDSKGAYTPVLIPKVVIGNLLPDDKLICVLCCRLGLLELCHQHVQFLIGECDRVKSTEFLHRILGTFDFRKADGNPVIPTFRDSEFSLIKAVNTGDYLTATLNKS